MQKEAESTSSAIQIDATQGGATQAVLQNTANAPTPSPYPTYTPYPTSTSPAIPTLTPTKTITILFDDNFNNGIRPEWELVSGTWIMTNGELSLSGIEQYKSKTNDKDKWSYGTAIFGDSLWQNYSVNAKFDLKDESANCGAVLVRVQDFQNFIAWEFCYFYNFSAAYNKLATWYIVQNGEWTEIPNTQLEEFPIDKQFSIKVIVKDDVIQSFVNNEQINSFSGLPFSSGKVGARIQSDSISNTLSFDDFLVETTAP